MKSLPCTERIEILESLSFSKNVIVVETAYTTKEKQAMFNKLKEGKREGIVFKKKNAPYTHGRPIKGGNQLKFKFYKTATFIISDITTGKRSVGLELVGEDGKMVYMGKVTIPANHEVPKIGDFVEIRYLYAYKGGAVYQSVYLGKRNDSDLSDAKINQIVYKNENIS